MKSIEEILKKAESENRFNLYEHEVYEVLSLIGMDVKRYDLVDEKTNFKKVLKNYGPKVVMKISSPDIAHKTDVGGVVFLDNNHKKVKKEYENMIKNVKEKKPDAKITGALLTEYVPIDHEVLVSMLYDEQFGHFLTVGLGGTLTEVYKDIAIRLAPANKNDIKEMLQELKSYPILAGYRGKKGANIEALVEQIHKLNMLEEKFSPYSNSKYLITELEINPIAASGEQAISIDGILNFKRKERKTIRQVNIEGIEKFFNPESVAVIGATDEKRPNGQDKEGKIIFENMLKSHAKNVYPVNPKKEQVLGKKCYKNLKEIEQPVDLAIVVVPAKATPQVMEDAKEKGVKNVIIIGGGFSELGSEGKKLEDQIRKTIKEGNIRVIGPNCVGTYSKETHLKTIFLSEDEFNVPEKEPNNVAVITQSGAVGINLMTSLRNVGIRSFVSIGNMIDPETDYAALLKYLENEKETEVIGLYVEGFKDGKRFYNNVKSLRKPVVIIKGGRSEAGSKATTSHTGSIAGNYDVARAAFKQAGIIEAETSQEFFDTIKMFSYSYKKKVEGNNIAIVSNAGGLGVLSADMTAKTNLKLAKYTELTKERLTKYYPDYLRNNVGDNPSDLGGGINDEDFIKCLHIILEDHNVNAVIVSPGVETQPMRDMPLINNIIRLFNEVNKPIIITMADSNSNRKLMDIMEEKNIPCYLTPEQGVKALDKYVSYKLSKK
ncbi:MAG: acetate--CoA ligase family protein [Nanoarchaeota archaeon]|nr:acetate--CoA ligase family protein [Nanoarchaeota archaeon]